MAIIHCGLVPHENKSINQTAGFQRNNPADHPLAIVGVPHQQA